MIHIDNNTESQLDELLCRTERKWIWDLCSITPNGLSHDDGYYCQSQRRRKRYVPYRTIRLFILIFLHIFLLLLLFHNIHFNGVVYSSLLLCAT